jgi:hypothetical protein
MTDDIEGEIRNRRRYLAGSEPDFDPSEELRSKSGDRLRRSGARSDGNSLNRILPGKGAASGVAGAKMLEHRQSY